MRYHISTSDQGLIRAAVEEITFHDGRCEVEHGQHENSSSSRDLLDTESVPTVSILNEQRHEAVHIRESEVPEANGKIEAGTTPRRNSLKYRVGLVLLAKEQRS